MLAREHIKVASKQVDGNLFTYTASESNFDEGKVESCANGSVEISCGRNNSGTIKLLFLGLFYP